MPYIELSGIKIHYISKGSGDALVILPDNLLTAQAYQQEMDHFSACYQVLSLDYPGSGKSSHEWMYLDEIHVDFWGFLADLIHYCSIYLSSKANHLYLERPFMWSDRSTFQIISDQFLPQAPGTKIEL